MRGVSRRAAPNNFGWRACALSATSAISFQITATQEGAEIDLQLSNVILNQFEGRPEAYGTVQAILCLVAGARGFDEQQREKAKALLLKRLGCKRTRGAWELRLNDCLEDKEAYALIDACRDSLAKLKIALTTEYRIRPSDLFDAMSRDDKRIGIQNWNKYLRVCELSERDVALLGPTIASRICETRDPAEEQWGRLDLRTMIRDAAPKPAAVEKHDGYFFGHHATVIEAVKPSSEQLERLRHLANVFCFKSVFLRREGKREEEYQRTLSPVAKLKPRFRSFMTPALLEATTCTAELPAHEVPRFELQCTLL